MSTIDRFSNYNKSNFSSKAESDQKTNANEAIDNQDPRKSGKKDELAATNPGLGSSGIQVAAVAILIKAALDQMNTYLKQFTINEQFQGAVNASSFAFAVGGAQQQQQSDDEAAEATAQQGWGAISQGITGAVSSAAGLLHSQLSESEEYDKAQTGITASKNGLTDVNSSPKGDVPSSNSNASQTPPDYASEIKNKLDTGSLFKSDGSLNLEQGAKTFLQTTDATSDLKKEVIEQIQNKINSYSSTITEINNTRSNKMNAYTSLGGSLGSMASGIAGVKAANSQTAAAANKAQATELSALASLYNTESQAFSQSAQQAVQSLQAVLSYLQGLNSANSFR